ncbi:MAG: DUF222 domain-containing protein [Microbacteriaceae bacterium]|nr:MAG: DUF222 domain-containing protein [Microbacteriaceae bacterium]
MTSITASLAVIGDVAVPFAAPTVSALRDVELLDGQRAIAEIRRRLDALAATVAGEIAHRSRRELGHEGLAQSRGQRSAEGLISQLTGTSAREARTLVRAAELLPVAPEGAVPAPPQPEWMRVVGDAVARAAISVEAADIIRTRLAAADRPHRDPAERARVDEALEDAARRLVAEAGAATLEQLAARAARSRDDIDAAGVVRREEVLREKRFLRFTPQLDGMTRVAGLLDPESAAILVPILDSATSPRRGGSRRRRAAARRPQARRPHPRHEGRPRVRGAH